MSDLQEVLKVGIVGPEEANLGDKALLAYDACSAILSNARSGVLVKSMDPRGIFAADFELMTRPKEVVLVSGRCPVSVCEACNRRSFLPADFPVNETTYTTCEFCGADKKRRAGGVDIYAEEKAIRNGYPTEIYAPEVNEWGNRDGKIGFRARNIKIARASDLLFVVTPRSTTQCKHCKVVGHMSSGACWTAQFAKNLGKRVLWIVV